jgi:L-cystine uptake protein TcyP (sodium:dicarboxylate symporter family)
VADKQNYITLNLSVPALERLMSECPELVLKLSQGVMEEYARRQVKAFADAALKETVQKVITSEMGTITTGYTPTLKLNPKFEAALLGVVTTRVAELKTEVLVEAATRAAAVSNEMKDTVGAKVEASVTAQVAQYIRNTVAAKLKALMDSV